MSAISDPAGQVEQLNRQWMQSYIRGDIGFLEQHLADDYVSVFPDGTVLDKKGGIEALRSGAVSIIGMEPREVSVRHYGDAAVITGRSTITAKVKGQEASGEYRFMDVWARQSDRWQAVASQVTRIANP